MAPLKWGIIGTGSIAKAFAHGLTQTERGTLLAVGSRSKESAERFGGEHEIERRYGSYEDLLADGDVEAIYVSTPHPFHAYWAVKAMEAGKHVLCEKPLALNHGQGMAMVETARENGVFFMEAFMYRCHPQTTKLVELLKEGVIGEVRMIRAAFGFGGGNTINPEGRLFDKALGGGGILDVGCYPVSMSRLVAGVAAGKDFADPVDVAAGGKLGETGVDEWAAAVLTFESGIVAQVATAVRASLDNSLEIVGADGRITVPNPWVADRQNPNPGQIIVAVKGKEEPRTIDIPAERTSFSYEAERVAAAVEARKQQGAWPAMTWGDSLGNLAALDAWRQGIGLSYDAESEAGHTPVRGTLERRPAAPMKYGRIEGLDKPVSKLIMGCDNQRTFAHGAAVWDDWYERGGNAFDTSWVYGGGIMEKLLGAWIKTRGVRGEVVVTVKGAHTPRCLPDLMVQDFEESLERLQFEFADIYVMHRDNPEVPVGEFVDALNDLIGRGLIRGALGGSNWSIERFKELNEYAAKKGKQGFAVLNDNLSLARMVHPVWRGCIHVSDTASRKWLQESGTTNFSWSSQARGYFLPEEERMKLGAKNFECWDSADNRARRERAYELAEKKGCSPLNIAAAYVINQPFPSFALVGPRFIHETATIMPALDVELSRAEIEWLWGGDA
jgi:predicted dehydrogenase/aryl-alcohol dehydrogenase-like predicted oxidoreductase